MANIFTLLRNLFNFQQYVVVLPKKGLSATCPQCSATRGGRVALSQARWTGMPHLEKKSKSDVVGFIKFLILLSVAIFFVTSCASQKDLVYLNKQVNALYRQTKKDGKRFEKSIKKLEEETQASDAKQKEIEKILREDQESLRLNLAQLGADLVEIKENIQSLTGRVEENSYLLKRTVEEDTTKEDFMVSQVKELSHMVGDLKKRIDKIEDYFGLETSVHKREAGLKKALPAKEIRKKDIPSTQEKRLTESEIYDRTLGYYRDGQHKEAIEGFKKFLKLYPESDLADNAQFWIGECHRAQQQYKEAILAYQGVINGYPKGNKVPSAMLHQALSFVKINDETTANLVFKKLLKDFPKSKEAEVARKILKQKKKVKSDLK